MVDQKASWLEWLAPERFNNQNLLRIVTFFVFHSPCPGLSAMGRTLEEYGWHTPWKKPFYLNKQLKKASESNCLLYPAASNVTIDEELEKASLSGNFAEADFSYERICFVDKKSNYFMSVFYHLRNAFAHCRLNMIEINSECVFLLEDVQPKSGQLILTARMVLRESTLLKWIDIIESGEHGYVANKAI